MAFGLASPNLSIVRAMLDDLQAQIVAGNQAGIAAKANAIVDFTLQKNAESALPGGNAAVATFTSNVFCYVAIDIRVEDPVNSTLILPTDTQQIIYNPIKSVGIKLPAGPVTSPTLLVIKVQENNNVRLNTKLDQYKGFIRIDVVSDVEDPFEGIANFEAVIGVCAEAPKFLFNEGRLRLGHGLRSNPGVEPAEYNGFEITPFKNLGAEGIGLVCPPPAVAAVSNSTGGARAKIVSGAAEVSEAPLLGEYSEEELAPFAGGIGGTVREFSPFSVVDEEVYAFAGGIGGTVREFLRMSTLMESAIRALTNGACTADNAIFQAPIGSPTRCTPAITVRTFQGTLLQNVPVSWNVLTGGGLIRPNAGLPCEVGGTSTASNMTGADGRAAVCWTLGGAGTNTLRATVGIGGDVPARASIRNGVERLFSATSNPPSKIAFTRSPAATETAGTAFAAKVEVRDVNGERVFGYNGPVTLTLNRNTLSGAPITYTATATAGEATFAITINTASTGIILTPSLPGGVTDAPTAPFAVLAAAARTIERVNFIVGQTLPSGNTMSPNPTVRVRDMYGNVVANASVSWTATQSSNSSVTPATTVTDALGLASATWQLGDGTNELKAALTSSPTVQTFFVATGSTTLVNLISCAPGSTGVAVNDPARALMFTLPNPGAARSYRSVQLYFSATGKPSRPDTYNVELSTQPLPPIWPTAFNEAGWSSVIVPVTLNGTANQNALTTFRLPEAIVGSAGGARVTARVRLVGTPPDAATILMNNGSCGSGALCTPVPGCEVSLVNPLNGAALRNVLAIVVRGTR